MSSPEFDPWADDDARRARDEAMHRADRRRGPQGHRAAEEIDRLIAQEAATGRPFSANTIRPLVPAGSASLIGARFLAAARRGEIEKIGTVQARHSAGHARTLNSWRGTRSPAGRPVRESLDTKARRLLANGKVRLYRLDEEGRLGAHVAGDTGHHTVRRDAGGRWTCSCPAASYQEDCSHVAAVALVVEPAGVGS